MKTMCRVLVAIVLTLASGCARPDWIQQTLVTVDVTGAWLGRGGNVELKLTQQGPKVTGSMIWRGIQPYGRLSGAIEGSVAGDVFRFVQTSGTDPRVEGELTVSEDEMAGDLRLASGRGASGVALRRVDSSRPGSQSQ